MNKHLEDRLIELAFEDRTDISSPEFAATPEAAGRLKEYQNLRSALGHLRDIPDHQLSTERLREALLHQGLKRRRSFPWQALGYTLTACGLFVCAYVVSRDVRRANAPSPKLVEAATAKASPGDVRLPVVQTPSIASNWFVPDENWTPDRISNHPQRAGLRQGTLHYVALNNVVPPLVRLATETPGGKASDTHRHALVAAPGAPNPPLSSNTAPVSNAMVLIQSQTDADTGLDTAKEVTSTGNVLVGG